MARPRVTEADDALDAASRRLAAHGVAGFTVDDVAEELEVSRATVYRYLGGRSEIIAAVIRREGQQVLAGLMPIIAPAPSLGELIAALVAGAVRGIDESAVLSRLSTVDLRDTLAFVTVDAGPLIDTIVAVLAPAIADGATFDLSGVQVDQAVEEATRLVLADLTIARRTGERLDSVELGERTSAMVAALFPGP